MSVYVLTTNPSGKRLQQDGTKPHKVAGEQTTSHGLESVHELQAADTETVPQACLA